MLLLCGGDKRTQDADVKRAKKLAGDWRQQGKAKPTAQPKVSKKRCSMGKRKSKVTVSRYDSADYLKTEEDMAAYLEACLEEAPDDASYLAAALGTIARARGMVQLSRDTGISRDGLYKALSKDGNPTFDTVLKVMRALGLRFEAKAA